MVVSTNANCQAWRGANDRRHIRRFRHNFERGWLLDDAAATVIHDNRKGMRAERSEPRQPTQQSRGGIDRQSCRSLQQPVMENIAIGILRPRTGNW